MDRTHSNSVKTKLVNKINQSSSDKLPVKSFRCLDLGLARDFKKDLLKNYKRGTNFGYNNRNSFYFLKISREVRLTK